MNQVELRARGVSPALRGWITNPLRRLLWPLHAPYFAALLDEMAELRRIAAQLAASAADEVRYEQLRNQQNEQERSRPFHDEMTGEAQADMLRRYDALKKDMTAIAHRLASFEEQATDHAASAAPVVAAGVEPARSSYAQCGEDRIVEYLLRVCGGPPAIRYLDIGAALPSGDSNTFLFYQQGGSGVLVEPDPGYRPAYHATRPRDLVECAALVPSGLRPADGMIELLVGENPGWTTILAEHAVEAQQRGKGGVQQRLMVPAITIAEVLERHFADGPLHLVSIDAEGIDDIIVREIDFDRYRPWVLVVETMGSDGPSEYLAQHGYTSYASTHVNRIFVRQDVLAGAVF